MTTAPKPAIAPQLLAIFFEELGGYVEAFNSDLLALEKDPEGAERPVRLKNLLRTAHSLKGAARSMDEAIMEGICHHLETLLGVMRQGPLAHASEIFAVCYQAVDAIEECGRRLRQPGQPSQAKAPSAVIAQLKAVVAATKAASGTASVPSGSAIPNGLQAVATPTELVSAAVAAVEPATDLAPEPPEIPLPSQLFPVDEADGPQALPPLPPSNTPLPTIRIPPEKLNVLLAQSGELLGALWRGQAWSNELEQVREDFTNKRREWQVTSLEQADKRAGAAAATAQEAVFEGMQQIEEKMEAMARGMAADWRRLNTVARTIDHEVRRLRMLPFGNACDSLERVARDLSKSIGKEVRLVISGTDVELDRSVHEALKDPLRHMLRNAIDHGIEAPAARLAAGKPAVATIAIKAKLQNSRVEVTITDDGRGILLDALRAQLTKQGRTVPTDDTELTHSIFLPGFSTAPIITEVSGRGIGLDVVKSRIESLHGTVDVVSTPGLGCSFTLSVPLTLTTLQALLVKSGGQTFAFAGSNVDQLLRFKLSDLRSLEGRQMYFHQGEPLPVATLASLLGLPDSSKQNRAGVVQAVVAAVGAMKVALVVDELIAEREVVVKNLGARIRRSRHVSGASILPSGQIALVLNAANLLRRRDQVGASASLRVASGDQAVVARKRIIVAEDSVTTRTMEKNILEAAGYEVLTAVDGEAAWGLLQEQGADLLVSDVEMPRLDGFELAKTVRRSLRFEHLPIVLLTALESKEHKALGIEVGANAYLVKNAFDQTNLLDTIAQLL